MLLPSDKNWVLDFFASRGWLVERRRCRRRAGSGDRPAIVAAEIQCLEQRLLLSGGIVHVGAAETYPTIQDGYAAAQNGDTILIDDGTYTLASTFVVGKPVTFQAVHIGGAIVSGGGFGDDDAVFRLSADATFIGLHLENAQHGLYQRDSGAHGIAKNLIITDVNEAIAINNSGGTSGSFDVLNATVYNVGRGVDINDGGTINVTNSIFDKVLDTAYVATDDIAINPSHNLLFKVTTVSGTTSSGHVSTDPAQLVGDPLFVNAAGGDFHLLFGSPAIDTGIDVGLPFSGAGPDRGAFESPARVIVNSTSGGVNYNVNVGIGQLNPGITPVTLRDAINAVNNSGVAATISFDSAVFGSSQTTIGTGGNELELKSTTGKITIQATTSQQVSINGGNFSRVFFIDPGVTAEFDNLTITGGGTTSYGGGINNHGTLILSGDSIVGNNADLNGIGEGGGINNNGPLTLINCTVAGNSVGGSTSLVEGGGIFNNMDNLTVIDSTIANNTAVGASGTSPSGAGIFMNDGTILALKGSILAGNTTAIEGSASVPGDFFGSPANVDAASSYNLVGDGANTGFVNGTGHNIVGMAGALVNPLLGPLADNGGPTQTLALLAGSPAVRAGAVFNDSSNRPIAADQRGAPRPGAAVDIGAFEVQIVAPTVNSLITNSNRPILTGTYDQQDANLLQVTVGISLFTLGTNSQLTSDGSGHWTLNLSEIIAPLPDGTYTITVHTTDAAGDAGDIAATNALTVDTDTPTPPSVNSLATNNPTPTITGTFAAESTVLTVKVNGTTYTLGTSSQLISSGTGWTLNLTGTTALPDGTYTVLVHTADAAGNSADITPNNALTVDTDSPAAPTVNSLITNNPTPTITGTFAAESTVLTVKINGTTYALGTSSQLTSSGTGWTLNLAGTTALPDGTYTVLVHTADAAGNVADDTTTNEITVVPDILGAWLINNKSTSIAQNGSSLTFTNENGESSPGVFLSATQVAATGWGNLAGTLSNNNQTLTWANNTVWTVAPPTNISGAWLINSKSTSIAQAGANLTFTNENGETSPGRFLSSNQVAATSWGNLIGTLSNNLQTLTWANNTVWTVAPPANISGAWQINSRSTSIARNGLNLTFTNENDETSPGKFLSSTQVEATGWGNLIGTLSNNNQTLTWANNTVWTVVPPPSISGAWLIKNKSTSIAQNGSSLTFTNENGESSPGIFLSATQVEATGWGNLIGALSNNNQTLTWANNTVWVHS